MVEDACSCFGELWYVLAGEAAALRASSPGGSLCHSKSSVKAGPGRKAVHATAAVTRRHDFDLLLGALSPCGRARRVALAARVGSH